MRKEISKCLGYAIDNGSPVFEGKTSLFKDKFSVEFELAQNGICYARNSMNAIDVFDIEWFEDKKQSIVSLMIILKVDKQKIRTDILRGQLNSWGESVLKIYPLAVMINKEVQYAKSYLLFQ